MMIPSFRRKIMANVITTAEKTNLQALVLARQERNRNFAEKPFSAKFQGAFMFDVTGSMFDYFDTCRKNISGIVSEIRKRIPESEFALGYFRNHGDEDRYGSIFSLAPFLADVKEISRRISDIKKGGGGSDGKCCIEECLQTANGLLWNPQGAKAIVTVVDTYPNGVNGKTKKCQNGIDWSSEVERLVEKQIKMYPIFTGDNEGVRDFYQKIAERTGGCLIPISEMHLMTGILVAIAMKETGNLTAYISHREYTGRITQKEKDVLLLLR